MDFLGGLLGAAGGIANAILGSGAAGAAQKQFQQATNQAIGTENQVLGTAQNNLQPFVGYGQTSGNALQGLLGIGGNPQAANQAFQNYLSSTPYQFLLNQGLQGQAYLNAPNLYSGATGRALNNYAQGMAGQAIFPYMQMLQGQEGMGITAGTNLGNIGTNIANLEQQALFSNANAQAGLGMYGTNALGQGINGLLGSSSFQNLLGKGINAFGNMFGGSGVVGGGNLGGGAWAPNYNQGQGGGYQSAFNWGYG